MFDEATKTQLKQYMTLLENPLVFKASLDDSAEGKKMREFLNSVTDLTDKITLEEVKLSRTPSFTIDRKDFVSGITFAGLPMGHEFPSFILAMVQVSGRAPKVSEEVAEKIKSITTPMNFETYVSLTCHNCPDVVQGLNIMSVLNPNITHTMVEGGANKAEVERLNIMAVPTVYLNGEEFSSGRATIEDLLGKVTTKVEDDYSNKEPFDCLIVGGGPAGASAAIYAARKGINTGMVVKEFGGQVLETLGIENIIGTPYTEGPDFMHQVEEHVKKYPVDMMKGHEALKIAKNDLVEVTLDNGNVLKSRTAIIATGAHWRSINVPGENEFKTKGVAYCPHCDGPLFTGKDIAVIGGGNSGIEAALDLAGIVNHVYVLEFLPELKADQILQDRLKEMKNVTVITNAATSAILGDKTVNSLTYKDRLSGDEKKIDVSGVFILIGLVPNTAWLKDTLELNERGEIVVDSRGATSLSHVYAAGDCTNSCYKQIIISMGSGATAALGAYDEMIREGK